jgi:hypothetical protein
MTSWTTLTFLLTSPPYNYTSFTIGLLGLLGIIGALLAPQWGRLIDKVVPWLGQLSGLLISLVAMIVALAAADINVGAVCVAIILYDCGQQLFQVSGSYRIAGIDPKARARLNGCYLLAVFAGQVSFPRARQLGGERELTDEPDIWNGDSDQDLQLVWLETNWRDCRCVRRSSTAHATCARTT